MKRILLAASFLVLFVCSAVWTGTAQQPGSAATDAARFTGKTEALENEGAAVGRRSFEAGARTAWHSHPRGQLLFVQQGSARIQKRGAAFRDLAQGDSDYTSPDVVHWHGATPTSPLVHVAVGFGGETKWLEKVSDEEYLGRRVR
jgi:quercetin dioxygenase-like cupin family protein